jgi:hypothetical protein
MVATSDAFPVEAAFLFAAAVSSPDPQIRLRTEKNSTDMTTSESKSSQTIGFLTVSEYDAQGMFGGYLVLNSVGRPLEFYCTAPVRPTRAQQILYGPTLKPYLYGEQIGRALLSKSRAKPQLVFTDVPSALTVRDVIPVPAVLVSPERLPETDAGGMETDADRPTSAADAPAPIEPTPFKLHFFHVGRQRLAVAESHASDQQRIVDLWQAHAEGFDLGEPFGRIREAIDEARRSATQAA